MSRDRAAPGFSKHANAHPPPLRAEVKCSDANDMPSHHRSGFRSDVAMLGRSSAPGRVWAAVTVGYDATAARESTDANGVVPARLPRSTSGRKRKK
jgi:hypothetical protein